MTKHDEQERPRRQAGEPLFQVDAEVRLPKAPQPGRRRSDPFGGHPPDLAPRLPRAAVAEQPAPQPKRRPHAPELIADDPFDDAPIEPAPPRHLSLLEEAERLAGPPRMSRPLTTPYIPPRPALALPDSGLLLALLVSIACIVVLVLFQTPERTILSGWPATGREAADGGAPAAPPAIPAPAGQSSVLGPPTLTAEQIDAVLAQWGSPAAGTGKAWVALGQQYGIDPAYALAFFIHESGAGTAPGWAGLKPGGGTTHNVGNIICAGYPTCYGRFRDYGSWEEGIADWYELIAVEYVAGRGVHTVEDIIPIYAPSFENNVPAYVGTVNKLVAEWRAGGIGQ